VKKWPSGDVYTGQVVDGNMQGKGEYVWANGVKFRGQFVNDMFAQGKAEKIWKTVTYVGETAEGMANGEGVKTWTSGTKITGTFKKDKANGAAVLTWTDGSVLRARFINGLAEGPGEKVQDGSIFKGNYKAG
jgi:hypothetical protein